MAAAHRMQLRVERRNTGIDPGRRPLDHGIFSGTALRPGARGNDGFEVLVDGDREGALADLPGKLAWHVKALQRNDPADFRLDPVKRVVLCAFRHRKYSGGIGFQQQLWRYCRHLMGQ
jgi:hypothetical protein